MADTAALVDMVVPNNATWQDAFQFSQNSDALWDFTGQKFIMEIKGNPNDTTVLLELTSDAGEIVVDSIANRILHLNVTYAALQAALHVGEYVYDFIMYDTGSPVVRVQLMRGKVCIGQGITGEP